MSQSTDFLSDIDALMTISERLEHAKADDPELGSAELDRLIRHVPGKRAILSGHFKGRPAVFRMFGDPASRTPKREWDEMTRIWPFMNGGDLRVAEPLHFNAVHAILVIEEVPGTPFLEHLYQSEPDQRAGQMADPAKWLRKYTKPSEVTHTHKAADWLMRAENESARQPHASLRRKEEKLITQLRRLLKSAEAHDWRFAISHGDYHPNNLILNSPRLTGIDLGGSARLPIYKDMARFLMHMGRRGMLPSGQSCYGVDRQGFDAFAGAFGLSAWEREIVLPFMLGVEALIRVEGPHMSKSRLRRAADMYDLLLADLKVL